MSEREGGESPPTARQERRPGVFPARRHLAPRLLVVGAVVLVLAALAVPRAFGTGGSGADSSAQSDLMNALASFRTLFIDHGMYPSTPWAISAVDEGEPELTLTASLVQSNATPHNVSLAVSPDGSIIVVADKSTDDRCWYAEDNEESTLTTGGLPLASAVHGLSYNATVQGYQATGSCGYADNYLNGNHIVGWGPSFPS
ncbi:MAG TPA: hypothetical protein VK277_03565 [Acidimicrobiales bacterium]|nr:hypothetical protein [Acidimicrobiales bacterium]